jgi:hypothetical protein
VTSVIALGVQLAALATADCARWSACGGQVRHSRRRNANVTSYRSSGFSSCELLNSLFVPSLQTASVHFSTAAAQQMASGAGTTVDVPSKARTLWVKKEGDPVFAKLRSTAEDVGDVTKEAVTELPSLQGKDLSTLILYMANDKEGRDLGPPLDSRATVAAAGLKNGASIVIKATGTAAAPTAAATPGQ